MSAVELKISLDEYKQQLAMVEEALGACEESSDKESLITLQSDLKQLIQLTQENLEVLAPSTAAKSPEQSTSSNDTKNVLDNEYALFMEEMTKSGAYEEDKKNSKTQKCDEGGDSDSDSDIEDELATLLGMKCAVYHTHKWGGQPTLYNAMVSEVIPRQDGDQFKDLQVRVLFTHPTHAEMLPCPFYLDGECRFDDEQCRYSHGSITQLTDLKEASEPNFDNVKIGSRVLVKLKPPDGEDISLKKKSTEKYHLWHRAVIKNVHLDKRKYLLKLEHSLKTGEKRKAASDELYVDYDDIYPLNEEANDSSESDDSLSDTDYSEMKPSQDDTCQSDELIMNSLPHTAALGQWEKHTRGIGSKLMLAMGYVPGTGLGVHGAGRVLPVTARLVQPGRSLDHCMEMAEKMADKDPLKMEKKLKRMQKKEEERNQRAYEREKEKERRNVFNFLNKTLGDKPEEVDSTPKNMKQSSNKDLNIEQFKITEEAKKLEREMVKLNSSLQRHDASTNSYKSINLQIAEKSKEINILKQKEQRIVKEQKQRKDKQKMTVF